MMWSKWFLLICLLAVVVCVLAGLAEKAWAVGGLDDLRVKGDKKAKQVITAEPPTKKEVAIGVGSVVVAILVLKYL